MEELSGCVEVLGVPGRVVTIAARHEDYHPFTGTGEKDAVGVAQQLASCIVLDNLPPGASEPSVDPSSLGWMTDKVPSPTETDEVELESLAGVLVRGYLERA